MRSEGHGFVLNRKNYSYNEQPEVVQHEKSSVYGDGTA